MNLRTLCVSLTTLAAGAALYAFQDEMPMAKPQAEHKLLQRGVGTWEALVDMGMGEPAKGVMVVETGPGGFTALSHFTADMGGMPFEGRGIDGYDVNKKKYVSVWTDSMAPSPMLMEGTWDEKSQTSTFYGDAMDAEAGKVVKHKLVTRWVGNDKMEFEMFVPGADGKDKKTLTIHYDRKK